MKKYLFIVLLFITTNVLASPPTRTSTYTSGTTIRSSDVSGNENAIFNYLQAGVDTYSAGSITNAAISGSAGIVYSKLSLSGSIVNNDIVASAGIPYSKLTLTGTIVNADVSASAAIVDTKLATISTAGKVSGAALTSLSSTPSGAGIIPIANLASGTPTGSKFIRDDGTLAAPSDTFKNVFSWVQSVVLTIADKFSTFGAITTGGAATTLEFNVPYSGTAKNFYVKVASSGDMVFSLYKNGSITSITCTALSGNSNCSDLTHTVSFTAGDTMSFSMNDAGGQTRVVSISMEYD